MSQWFYLATSWVATNGQAVGRSQLFYVTVGWVVTYVVIIAWYFMSATPKEDK